jgi:hypothetical protein
LITSVGRVTEDPDPDDEEPVEGADEPALEPSDPDEAEESDADPPVASFTMLLTGLLAPPLPPLSSETTEAGTCAEATPDHIRLARSSDAPMAVVRVTVLRRPGLI